MNLNFIRRQSLKTRVTLFTLVIFMTGIWSLWFHASQMLREDMQLLSGDQQFSTVSIIAAGINDEVDIRIKWLKNIADKVSPAMLGNRVSLQKYLEDRSVLLNMFNGGVIAVGRDGTTIADVPLSAGRIGVNYMYADHVAAALREGQSSIGRPVIGQKLRVPIVTMATPIRDPQGNTVGALIGVIDLSKPNFLDKVTGNHYGKTGGYLLIATQHRLVIAATDKSGIMQTLPAPGVNPQMDRFIRGYEGSAIYRNSLGVEILNSVKAIPVAGWNLAANLPTEEAFAPIHTMQRRMLIATILLTLLAGSLTWWMLKHQLAPMLDTANALATMSQTGQPLKPLPITSEDEIGDLIGGFNHLLEILEQREDALKNSEQSLRVSEKQLLKSQQISHTGSWIYNLETKKVWASGEALRLFGYPPVSRDFPIDDIENHIPERERVHQALVALISEGRDYDLEYTINPADGSPAKMIHSIAQLETAVQGKPMMVLGFIQDITESKHAEAELLQLAESLEIQVQERTARLRSVSAQLTRAEERERRNLALELHDNLSQLLAAIKLRLDLLADDKLQPSIHQITKLVDQASQAARMITRQLSPPILDTPGIVPALEWLAEEMERTYQLTVHIDIAGEPIVLEEVVEAVLYRSVRELLINISKHAQVTEAQLSRLSDASQLLLIVSDEGSGFDTANLHNNLSKQHGFGLISIYERITNIGGAMTIDSCLSHGTTITLSIPFSIAAKEVQ